MSQATLELADTLTVQLKQRLDIGLFLVVVALIGLGLVMVASSSIGVAEKTYHDPFHFIVRQSVYVAIGMALAFVMYELPLRLWETMGPFLLLLSFALLVLVLIPGVGKTVNGATRWVDLAVFDIQVSEIVKLLMVMYMAGYIVRHVEAIRSTLGGFFKPLAVVAALSGLLLIEPDFGASVVILLVTMGMMFLGGVRLVQFASLFAIAAGLFAIIAVATPYRLQRLTSFLDPWADPLHTGYQLTQALIAIGSGSWFGAGLGSSIQKLFYLPEAHNDFMFAILAEELGLVGVMTVLLLFVYAVWRAFAIGATAERSGHLFGAYIAFGIGLWVGIQAFVNIGVNMGILPTKGLTLPFMSAGGSSMIMMCAAMGLLLRVHRETHDLKLKGVRSKGRTRKAKR
jgi:cell division protein FtsW